MASECQIEFRNSLPVVQGPFGTSGPANSVWAPLRLLQVQPQPPPQVKVLLRPAHSTTTALSSLDNFFPSAYFFYRCLPPLYILFSSLQSSSSRRHPPVLLHTASLTAHHSHVVEYRKEYAPLGLRALANRYQSSRKLT